MIALLLATLAHAATVTSTGLPQYVSDLQAANGCVVVVAVQRDSAQEARNALGVATAVHPVDPADWEAFRLAPDVPGRCVAAITALGSGRWDAEFLGVGVSKGTARIPEGHPSPNGGMVALELVGGTVAEGIGALLGDVLGYNLIHSRFLTHDTTAPRRTVSEAWGAGIGAATFGAAAVWGIGAIGDKHGSPVWTLVGASAGIGLGAVVVAASDHDGAIDDIGKTIEFIGAPIGGVIGLNATLKFDQDGVATVGCGPARAGIRCGVVARW